MGKKKIAIISVATLTALAIIIYSLIYIFVPVGTLFIEGEQIQSVSLQFTYAKFDTPTFENRTVILEGEDCEDFVKLIKGVKIYHETFLSPKHNDGIPNSININFPTIYEDGEKGHRTFMVDEFNLPFFNREKNCVIDPFVTEEEHLNFYNSIFEYYYKGQIVEKYE